MPENALFEVTDDGPEFVIIEIYDAGGRPNSFTLRNTDANALADALKLKARKNRAQLLEEAKA